MVVTSYLSGLCTVIEQSQYHIIVVSILNSSGLNKPYIWGCNSRTVSYSVVVNHTIVAELIFILKAEWLIVYLTQF